MTTPEQSIEFTAPCPAGGHDCTWLSAAIPNTDKKASRSDVAICGTCDVVLGVWTVAAQTQRRTALTAAAADITSRRTA